MLEANCFISNLHTNLLTLSLLLPRSYCGLVSFWISREINDKKSKKSKKWIARGVEYKNEIDKLAMSASAWNFQNSK
jgi:hypothetical protein